MSKTASVATIKPGEQLAYDIQLSCNGLTEGCVDATIVDVLPAEFEVTSLPSTSSEREVTYDAGTRTLTVKFRIPLSSPAATTGLPGRAEPDDPDRTTATVGDVST